MKKHHLLLVLALVASALQAQKPDMYTVLYHDTTAYYYDCLNYMQQRDGDLVTELFLFEDIGNNNSVPFGNMFCKLSRTPSLAITDSLIVENTTRQYSLLARDPRGEGNIRAVFEYREDCDSSFVHISRFADNDLYFNPEDEIVVPVCEGAAMGGRYGSLIDSQGDLVMTFYKPRTEQTCDEYIVRIGLDGTIKQLALLIEDERTDAGPFRELKDTPLQYYQWHTSSYLYDNDLAIDVIDSTFSKNTVILSRILHKELVLPNPYDSLFEYEYLTINHDTDVIPAGGNDVLVAAKYTLDTNFLAMTRDEGLAVAKFDLVKKQLKGYVVFNDFHWYGSIGFPMRLKMLDDGTVYFMYIEHGYPEDGVNIVKMDANMNVEWKRFCKTGIRIITTSNPPIALEDEAGLENGVAWCLYGSKSGVYGKSGWLYFILNHDGPVGINESGIEIRPYNCYPNPTQDQLHLEFSPDVSPILIELYDIQGRLLQSQSSGFQSFNMQGLPAGQYLMKVTLEDGKVFTNKVMKE